MLKIYYIRLLKVHSSNKWLERAHSWLGLQHVPQLAPSGLCNDLDYALVIYSTLVHTALERFLLYILELQLLPIKGFHVLKLLSDLEKGIKACYILKKN